MNSPVVTEQPPAGAQSQQIQPQRKVRKRRRRAKTSLTAQGEPMVWLTGGALAISLAMIVGLLLFILYQGCATFWPQRVVEVKTYGGETFVGEQTKTNWYQPEPAEVESLSAAADARLTKELAQNDDWIQRIQLRTGNKELTGSHYDWISDYNISEKSQPEWAVVVERMEWGRFYGFPVAFLIDGEKVADTPEESWALYNKHHADSRQRWEQRKHLEEVDLGEVSKRIEDARLGIRRAELAAQSAGDDLANSPDVKQAKEEFARVSEETNAEVSAIRDKADKLRAENDRYQLQMKIADGREEPLRLADVVRAYPANQLGFGQRMGVYFSRWWEFLSDEPREANSEGGVWPAIFGTVVMTLGMTIFVLPLGVFAALYLREYAKQSALVSVVRIAINNLAGVPSIVYGMFGFGFFCVFIGGYLIDPVFFAEKLPTPTLGKGALIWASLTLALLTLPVVIVAAEEAFSAVPNSMREGSYACGGSKAQTIWRIVLPHAAPGIMTGMILSMARGAGEVAPLMLVGAVKMAEDLPVSTEAPFVDGSFMHLGFHIFDLAFHGQDSESALPMMFTTTLLLIGIIAVLNIVAIALRSRLRRRFASNQF